MFVSVTPTNVSMGGVSVPAVGAVGAVAAIVDVRVDISGSMGGCVGTGESGRGCGCECEGGCECECGCVSEDPGFTNWFDAEGIMSPCCSIK